MLRVFGLHEGDEDRQRAASLYLEHREGFPTVSEAMKSLGAVVRAIALTDVNMVTPKACCPHCGGDLNVPTPRQFMDAAEMVVRSWFDNRMVDMPGELEEAGWSVAWEYSTREAVKVCSVEQVLRSFAFPEHVQGEWRVSRFTAAPGLPQGLQGTYEENLGVDYFNIVCGSP